ncbi:hypothetical protein CUM88_00385 [Enterococcus faecium]|nr:hypothetical protein [Enterococcus faecium]EGP5345262.1 hypothetical protein [Enterococcus faecium]EGP5396122.1 hypothetical protein [Enterococcus faecium]EGP5442085.1 hypothetical protein [Enterococcus faecium]PQB53589.1 hypothetical protein CUM90_10865 [Enterococcus faecium]
MSANFSWLFSSYLEIKNFSTYPLYNFLVNFSVFFQSFLALVAAISSHHCVRYHYLDLELYPQN